jgi:serine/threonine-protein kinase
VALLERLLADDPADRPASAGDVLRALTPFVAREFPASSRAGDEAPAGTGGLRMTARPSGAGTSPDDLPAAGTRIVAIIPAYPGAGATFAAFSLSAALSARGVAHAVVECPGTAPEHYELLHGARRMPAYAPFADPAGIGPTGPAWRQGAAAYFPLAPDTPAHAQPEDRFARWLRRLGYPFVLVDGSGVSDEPPRACRLAEWADEWLIVADCVPAKWTDARRDALRRAIDTARERGVAVRWLGNRDQRFSRRREWLALYPEPPVVMLPQFPPEVMTNAAWDGTVVPRAPAFVQALDRAWERLLERWGCIWRGKDAANPTR